MNSENRPQTKILARLAPEDFLGRSLQLEKLAEHARGETGKPGLLLLAAPAAGASELLRQTYDRIFYEQGEIIPFYFSINQTDRTAKECAFRFLQTFLLQVVAFRRGDAGFFDVSPEISEIAELASAGDAHWVSQLTAAYERENGGGSGDERTFVRNCLSAPLRAAAAGAGARIFVMIDDLQTAENFAGETNLLEELKEVYSRSPVQFVFAGKRRYLLKAAQSGGGGATLQNPELLRLYPLSPADAEILTEKLSEKYRVKINEQTRDLIVRQFNSNPFFIESIFIAASERKKGLDSFQKVQQTYVDELFGGRIGRFYDTQFYEVAPAVLTQTQIVRLLRNTAAKDIKRSKIEAWKKHFGLADGDFYRLLGGLHMREIINLNSNMIEAAGREDLCLQDYIETRYRLEMLNEQRALVVGEHLASALERASKLMTRFYRRTSAVGLRQLLGVFNCQAVPATLLDYARFKEDYKGAPEDEIVRKLGAEKERLELPQIVFTAHGAAFYPPLNQVADEERSAVALGFEAADYRKENEVVWVAAEIDSKLEASAQLTEFWCDRLEMVALACNFSKYQLWLITPEGFSAEAVEILKQRKAFGSSRGQIKMLVKYLKAEDVFEEKQNLNEYEMVVPMGDDTELISARAVEEIARRHDFQPKAITQIKTALVEACINAAEHSLSPDRKIYQKFTIEDDKIVITISNRGVKMPSEKVAEMTSQIEPPAEGRRGWGLKLMRTLMDEVKFEQVDDGTRISMVKYLR